MHSFVFLRVHSWFTSFPPCRLPTAHLFRSPAMPRPNRAPVVAGRPSRHAGRHANPLYGYGYNPAWPSILSVAHDEANGGRLFVVTDRPCVLSPPANSTRLPLAVA